MSYTEYFFLLQPSEIVKHRIKYYKSFAGSVVGDYPSINSTAHISITKRDRQKPTFMKSYLDNIRSRIMSIPAVNLHVEGFKSFNHKNEAMTIYADIKRSYKIDNWFNNLRQELKCDPVNPHITIAKTIPVEFYIMLWPHFKNMPYEDTFTADRLTILEREAYNKYAKWKMYEEIPFKKVV